LFAKLFRATGISALSKARVSFVEPQRPPAFHRQSAKNLKRFKYLRKQERAPRG
jgi:hypothetical protein